MTNIYIKIYSLKFILGNVLSKIIKGSKQWICIIYGVVFLSHRKGVKDQNQHII